MVGKLIVEAIGTFFLVFTVGQTVMKPNDAGALAPLAIGSALMIMVYAGGHFSGGHYNPAVTLGVTMRGKLSWAEAGPYMVAQVVGAVLAAALVIFLKGGQAKPPASGENIVAKLIVEFLFTFALVYVVLNSATAKGTVEQLVLWTGDRLHRCGRGLCRGAHLRRSVQSGGRSRRNGHGPLADTGYLDPAWWPISRAAPRRRSSSMPLDMGGDRKVDLISHASRARASQGAVP